MKKITSLTIASLLLALVLTTGVALAESASSSSKAKGDDKALTNLIAHSDKAITARIDALNTLATRINDMKLVSADSKASLASQIQNQIGGLTALKTKIDADTDLPTLKTDAKTITGSFRVFALVIPQGQIIAAADRLNTIAGDLSAVAGKLQTRLNDALSAGKDIIKLTTALTDLNAKVTDAQTQAQAAINRIANLAPDNGDATVMAANKTALTQSRADLHVGQQDVVTARQDIEAIRKGIKAFKLPAPGTASTTAN